MEKISSIFVLGLLSSTAIAEVPNSFVPGEVATAAKFNENFTHLSSEISDVKNKVDNLSGNSGAASENTLPENTFLAKVNGVDMEVTNHMVGRYSIKTPTGLYISVDSEGYPGDDHLMYESDDCTGQAYKEDYSFRGYEGKPLGYTFKNPVFSGVKSIVYSNGFLGYLDDELIRLNYSSFRNGRKCSKWENTRLVFKVLPNDPSVTGIDSMPLVITGIGEELSISPIEIGSPKPVERTEPRDVYANGVKIGTTSYSPSYYGISNYISVELNNGDDINLYKDGSYSGNSVGTETLYYRSSDCSGTPYHLVASGVDNKWLNVSNWKGKLIKNQGEYYQLSEQLYRASSPFLSTKRYYDTPCEKSTQDGTDKIYAAATLTDAPEVPVFTPPITIEGYSEPTPYDSLPEAF